jgi:hypothetical protein
MMSPLAVVVAPLAAAALSRYVFVVREREGLHAPTEYLANREDDLVVFAHGLAGRGSRGKGAGRQGAQHQQGKNPGHELSPGLIRRVF